jgi:hypothetical protein
MTKEEELELVIKGLLSTMPLEDAKKVVACVKEIQTVLDKYGDHGSMAIAVIGSALAAKS